MTREEFHAYAGATLDAASEIVECKALHLATVADVRNFDAELARLILANYEAIEALHAHLAKKLGLG